MTDRPEKQTEFYLDATVPTVYIQYSPMARTPFLSVSAASEEPLYEQLKRSIRRAVIRRDIAEGDALPSFRGLAADLRVSLITVKRAYDDLAAEGVLAARQGRGTFVAAGALEACRAAAAAEVETLLRAAVESAHAAGIPAEHVARKLDRLIREEPSA